MCECGEVETPHHVVKECGRHIAGRPGMLNIKDENPHTIPFFGHREEEEEEEEKKVRLGSYRFLGEFGEICEWRIRKRRDLGEML